MTQISNNSTNPKQSKFTVIKWILAVLFILASLGAFKEVKIAAGLIFLILGILFLPPVSEQIKEKFKLWQSKGMRYISYVALFVIASTFISRAEKQKLEASPEYIVEQFIKSHSKNPLISTIDTLKNLEKLFNLNDNVTFPAGSEYKTQKNGTVIFSPKISYRDSLYKDYQNSADGKKMLDYDLILALNKGKVSSVKVSVLYYNETKRAEFDSINLPPVSKWINKSEIAKVKAMKAKLQVAQENLQSIQEEKAKFEKECFSAYDGSNTSLVNYVKENMNDDDSFEHISTDYKLQNDYAIIIMKFRGKNKFGAMVINQVTAKIGYDCQVIEVSQ